MVNQRDRKVIETEVGKMVERAELGSSWFEWESMRFRFWTPFGGIPSYITIFGDTTDEMIEGIRVGVNDILSEMIKTLESSKLLYKFGKGGVTV